MCDKESLTQMKSCIGGDEEEHYMIISEGNVTKYILKYWCYSLLK